MSDIHKELSEAFGVTVNESEQPDVEETETTETETETSEQTSDDVDVSEQDSEEEEQPDEFEKQITDYFNDGKLKYLKEIKTVKDVNELRDLVQQGFDRNRQFDKNKELKNQINSYNDLVKEIYPQFDNLEKFLQAVIQNELKFIEDENKEKYQDEVDYQKILKGDERYQKLKNLEPIKFNAQKEEEDFNEQLKELNESFGQDFDSYKELPFDVREMAAEHNLNLIDSYFLINKDDIIKEKLDKQEKKLIAELQENKRKNISNKSASKESTNQLTELDMEFNKYFKLPEENLKNVVKSRRKK